VVFLGVGSVMVGSFIIGVKIKDGMLMSCDIKDGSLLVVDFKWG